MIIRVIASWHDANRHDIHDQRSCLKCLSARMICQQISIVSDVFTGKKMINALAKNPEKYTT
jgi:hypothetical protein